MKILFLRNNLCADKYIEHLKTCGHQVVVKTEVLQEQWVREQIFDCAISYTYRYIINKSIIELLKGNIVNLHTSYLPWNRGANPNLWSAIEKTPRGVTLHFVNEELDKGKIITQRLVPFEKEATLASSYEQLDLEAFELFKNAFMFYEVWKDMAYQATAKGTYHSVAQSKQVIEQFPSWNVSVEEVANITRLIDQGKN